MASDVSICNRGLQKLGAGRIVSLTENSTNARECAACYEELRDAELRAHTWGFAIKRVQLAADTSAPVFGPANSFTLPADFLRLLPVDPEDLTNSEDWRIEGRKLLTNDSAPLNLRYIYQCEDANEMDALFRESLASRIAYELCEKITQSNQKKQAAANDYKRAINEAKRVNAIEKEAEESPEDTWVSVRR